MRGGDGDQAERRSLLLSFGAISALSWDQALRRATLNAGLI